MRTNAKCLVEASVFAFITSPVALDSCFQAVSNRQTNVSQMNASNAFKCASALACAHLWNRTGRVEFHYGIRSVCLRLYVSMG